MTQGNSTVPLTLKLYRGDELVRTERFAQSVIKVGKLPSSHLRLDDENVSRMHAVIEVTSPDEIYVIDIGSTSGTVVNGKKVNKSKLASGDEIVIGDTRIVVEIGAAGAFSDDVQTVVSAPPVSVLQASGAPAAPSVPVPAFVAPGAAPLPNPFAAGSASVPAAASPASSPSDSHGGHGAPAEDPDTIQYGIVASGPAVSPSEVESDESAIEVVLMWGDRSVLHVAHLNPPRSFYVGDETNAKGKLQTDFLVGSEVIGASRLPIVVASGGAPSVVVPSGATGDVIIGDARTTFAELAASGRLQACGEAAGAQQFALPSGATAKVNYNGFTFLVRPVQAGKRVGVGGPGIQWKNYIWTAASFGLHASFLLLFYFLPPRPASLALDLLNADSRLVRYLIEPPETQEEELPEFLQQTQQQDDSGGKGKRHKDEEGQMGKNDAKKTKNRFGIEGPQDNEDPHMAREAALENARNAGILGILRQSQGAWNSPTSPYGRDTALGNDPMSALGALMGDQIGENFGFGGLGLRGTGRGGGGTGEGTIGLGNLGTIGHGAGGGDGSGYGRGAGGFGGRAARVPQIRQGNADVRGSLSKEVIKRVIRRHINEVRFCYEQELNQRPDLEGRVAIRFIIAPDGAVQSAAVAESTMGSGRVDGCIADAVRRWTFPAPDGGGIVVVTYPFTFQPQGG